MDLSRRPSPRTCMAGASLMKERSRRRIGKGVLRARSAQDVKRELDKGSWNAYQCEFDCGQINGGASVAHRAFDEVQIDLRGRDRELAEAVR